MSAQYRFDSWTTDNGLPQNGVRAITQTPDGYLWFTTLDGLVRFDGMRFTVFDKSDSKGIINNRFWIARAAVDGSIWATTETGDLTIYRDGFFDSYPAERVPDQILGFKPDAKGEMMIETSKAFYYFRNGEFVFAGATENDGTLKYIHYGQTGTRWEINQTKTRREKDGQVQIYSLAVKNIDFYSGSAYEDRAGGLWIGEIGELFYLRDGAIRHYTAKDGIPAKTRPHRFWEDADGSLWFATGDYNLGGAGLIRFKDGRFARFGAESGLSNDRIFDVFKDREGTIWLATDKGLNRLRRQIITSLSASDGLISNETYPILQTRSGDVLIGTTGGLSRYKDGKFTNTILRFDNTPATAVSVQSLWEDDGGRIWIGAFGGLFVLENGRVKEVKNLFGSTQTIWAIRPDHSGNIWFASDRGGVFQYKKDKIVAQFTTAEGLAGNDVKVIHEAGDGTLWFGTYGGLSHFKDGKFINYTVKDGLGSDRVRSITEDADGILWIGTYDGGLSRFKDGRFFNFNAANGLSSNGAFAVMEDRQGNFWISGNKGIYRVNKQQLNDFADGRIDHYESFIYGKPDGMLNTECNGGRQPSALKDKDGRIWFPTLEGAAIVNPDLLVKNPQPPPVQIETVEIDREKMPFGETIRVAPSQTHLDINYTALSFIKSDQIHFRYRLEGLDKDWVDAGTRRAVSYAYLPAGEYVFRVTAANTDGVWNPDGKSIKIVVLAPFYKTRSFVALLLLGAIGIGFLIYSYRVRQLKKLNLAQEAFSRQLIESQEAERKRIAQELHDSLGQNLLVIKNRALLGLAVKENTSEANEQFSEIQESAADALSEARIIAYNLRPLHLDQFGLTSTLEEMIEETEAASGIIINCDIGRIDGLFSPENEINIYRIVQESLNNIVKHSKAKRAGVEVFRENRNVRLTVRDDGSGFDVEYAKTKKGLGLNGITERVRILGGNYSIKSEPGSGTTITIEVKI